MNKNKKNTKQYTAFGLTLAIFLVMSFLIILSARAESISTINNASSSSSSDCGLFADGSSDKDKCEELQKRAEIYREIIDIKKKQGETLNNQLSITDASIQQVQVQMEASKQRIDDFNSQISRIEAQAKEKENMIAAQRNILANLMQSYYEVNLASPLITYLSGSNLASFIVKKDRIAQVGDKINELVDSVKSIKESLDLQSAELDKKKGEVVVISEKLQKQGSTLEDAKEQKANLLAQTRGEEARYAQLLQRVEQQKQELLNIDQLFLSGNFSVGGLSASEYIEKNKPPAESLASTSWFYSQKDPRWADVNIGNSSSDMKNWGCAVTSIAMVAKFHGDSITPGSLAKKPIYSFDLIKWQMDGWPGAKIELVAQYGSAHRNLNLAAVDTAIKNKQPVIVYIGKTGGKGGHYVVIHSKNAKTGKYVVHDPYFGANLYLDTSRALVGAMGVNTSTYMDQMIIYN